MFDLIAVIVLALFVVLLVKPLRALTSFLKVKQEDIRGKSVKDFIETSTERVLRITEEQFGKKNSIDDVKKLTFAEGILNDVLREAGFDVTKFNIKGLLQAKKQEKGL